MEEEGKWTLRRPTPVTAAAGPSRPRIQFVDSYLPFVEPAPREVEVVGLGGGGGRMAFGGFGTKEEVAEEDEEEGMEGMDSEDEPSEVVTRKPKDKNSSKGKEKSTEVSPRPTVLTTAINTGPNSRSTTITHLPASTGFRDSDCDSTEDSS